MLAIAGLARLPAIWKESSRLSRLSAELTDTRERENRMNDFIENIRTQAASITSEISARNQIIDNASFTRLGSTDISQFIDELPELFSAAGVKVTNLGYQARETIENFIDLPFVAHIQCNYPGMRRMLHALETHQAGINIEQLEFVNLDDDQHLTKLRLLCRVRFKSVGQ
ncbi:MAG: hypothetical protein CVV42_10050 [Candidatus Riflebacteria bacterium HGW-Riflebacteria-2]|nr:MAG: hypothetical protein CVV42_10050 [Candidatus Riflebacteria bacterium HGW-Riflebacteria-2]